MAYHLGNPTGRKPGRPTGSTREYRIGLQLSAAEVEMIEAAAEAAGLPVAVFCRTAAVQAARAQASEAAR